MKTILGYFTTVYIGCYYNCLTLDLTICSAGTSAAKCSLIGVNVLAETWIDAGQRFLEWEWPHEIVWVIKKPVSRIPIMKYISLNSHVCVFLA